ncbi:DUF4215 domain-containing protein [Candidatus Woesearchaeota archaeon]|nr:DUF4215 domain-containing protein [Candidatus Woesearchaeota archaeon]
MALACHCGDGLINVAGEECDEGEDNAAWCNPGLSSCAYCSETCEEVTIDTPCVPRTPDDIILDLGLGVDFIVSNRDHDDATLGPFSVSIPKGNYEVTLVSHDGYEGRSNANQQHEQWFLALSDEDPLTKTSETTDLPDYEEYVTISEVTDTSLTLERDATNVLAEHAYYPDTSSPNSVRPFCAVFTPAPVCGDGIVQGDEECDDGNDVDYDECSDDCKTQYCEFRFEKTDDKDPVKPGDSLSYRIELENTGTAYCTGGGVQVTEHYDAMTSYVSSSPTPKSGDDHWNFGTVMPGDLHVIDIQMTVSEEAACDSTLLNEVCVWSDQLGTQCIEEETTVECLSYCGDGIVQHPNDHGEYEECDGESYCAVDCTYLDLSCVEALQAGLLSGSITGGSATVTNGAPHDYEVGLAVYEKFDEVIANQVLYDFDEDVAPAFGSVDLSVSLPECAYQIDLFCGDAITDLSQELYGDRKIDWEHNNDNGYCVDEYCGDGIVHEGEECDDGNNVDGDGCSATCEIEPLILKAYKVVCEAEEHLPDWGLSGTQPGEPTILDDGTAAEYVAANNEHCWLEDGWSFQWGYSDVPKLDGSFIGPTTTGAGYDEWKDFDTPTNPGGVPATAEIYDLRESPHLWVRENLQAGYIPFVNPPGDPQDPVSAELYCGNDVLNFDNYDWVGDLQLGKTYHCIAFNALEHVPGCGDGFLDDGEECDRGEDNGIPCVPGYGSSCTYCSETCEEVVLQGPFCGDGLLQDPPETCDNGTLNGVACTPGYGGTCTYCSGSCQPETEEGPFCGDGIVNGEEECDGTAGVPEGYACTEECSLEWIPDCLDIAYKDPYYTNGTSQWIDTASRVELVIINEVDACLEGDHRYRYYEADDAYCLGACDAWQPGIDGWTPYTEPFALPSEACYVIEHYSWTTYGDSSIGWDCVFVDKTPPVITKEVGAPSGPMPLDQQSLGAHYYPVIDPEGENYCAFTGNCWQVSKDTDILVSCDDLGDYPSGVQDICFTVLLDGDDATADYCEGTMVDGKCCVGSDPFTLRFGEDSWHELNITCKDRVNKASADLEYFKVTGEEFTLHLNKKWNLVSVPFTLLNDSPGHVFGDYPEVAGAWYYNASSDSWLIWKPDAPSDLHHLKPGAGYWVLTTGATDIPLFGHQGIHPELYVDVKMGWNMIGYYGTDGQSSFDGYVGNGKTAACALSSLSPSVDVKGYSSLLGYWEPFTDKWLYFDESSRMDPGAGYWLFATRDGMYAPSTTC